jgi:hypothetical protein
LRVGIEAVRSAFRRRNPVDVPGRMHGPELFPAHGWRGQDLHARLQPGFAYPPPRGVQARRPLRVSGAGIVLPKGRVVVKADPYRAHFRY